VPFGPVAIIDIGSNSIKSLVAARDADGGIITLASRTIDARISTGISDATAGLSGEGMNAGIDAIRSLLEDAGTYAPTRTVLVATSAVRDATNAEEFRKRVRASTGQDIRILTGVQEANLIGRGLMADSALRDLQNFYVFDLGGGSLECLAFRRRQVEQAVSLPLGCVRLTEKFVTDRHLPFAPEAAQAIGSYTASELSGSSFRFSLPPSAVAVGTGGTIATVRSILAARNVTSFEATSVTVTIEQLRELLTTLGALPLSERRAIRGLPPGRADVFPAALVTLIRVAELGGFSAYRNSVHTLRYGVACESLA
jgi:exopolyphosphatase / guanosine-5'-triphosphate,3'-diphosphate pyrophosphatase